MAQKWYGSVQNRIEERMNDSNNITVGMGVTEFRWSDREAYEVIEVEDQKHITIRRLDHIHVGGAYENSWELLSNPENPSIKVVKRGNYWYTFATVTEEDVADYESWDIDHKLWLIHWGFDLQHIREKGKQTKYSKMNIRVGRAEYYYDYEF